MLSPAPPQPPEEIYIGGEVNNPGYYPLKAKDTIATLIQTAGGMTSNTHPDQIKLYLSETENEAPQKIDLNRAEVWLLTTLPGIGDKRAKAIIDYRNRNGPFRNKNELSRVAGIGLKTYELIKQLITVAD